MNADLKVHYYTDASDPTWEVFVVSRKAKDTFPGVCSFHILKMKFEDWKFMVSHNHNLTIA